MRKAMICIYAVLWAVILGGMAMAEPGSPNRVVPVPEPACMAVLGSALFGGLISRRLFKRD